MSKILLINTLPFPQYWENCSEPSWGIPLGLLNIGTYLSKNNLEVEIIDPVVDRNYLELIAENIKDAFWVGISTMTATVNSALYISKFIKNFDRNLTICWGGVHPTLYINSIVLNENIDYACWGEGEKFAVDLSRFLEGAVPIENVEGISYLDKGTVQFIPRKSFLDINEIAVPDYSLLDMNKYLYRTLSLSLEIKSKPTRLVSISSGIGCLYHCAFCWNTHPSQKFRLKNIENLIADIDHVVKGYDPDIIHLLGDLFFADKNRINGFLDHYEKRNYRFKWFTLSRVNYFRNTYINEDLLRRLKRNGCIWLGFGVESGSDKIRKKLSKRITETQVMETARLLDKCDIAAAFSFLMGLPYEKRQHNLESIAMMKRIKSIYPKVMFNFSYFSPYPGTPLYEEAIENGFVPPEGLEEWSLLQDEATRAGIKSEIVPWYKRSEWHYFLNIVHISLNRGGFSNTSPMAAMIFMVQRIVLDFSFKVRSALGFWRWLGLEGLVIKALNLMRRIPGFIPKLEKSPELEYMEE